MIATEQAPVLTFDGTTGVSVDLERLIASRALIQANSGGGKSRALRFLLEQTHGRVQQIVLDPEGEFATLRERFDYVLAGKEGDVPADPRSAKLLCRRLMELGVSAVIDLYDLSLPDRRSFVRFFLEELVHLPRTLWRPLIVALDEAHIFCPERGSGEAESTDAVITACTLGRKRGFCPILATQRLSKLHKDAAAELLNVLIGRTQLDVDAKRAGDVLGFDKEQRAALRDLPPGHFYAFGPAIAAPGVTMVRTGDVTTSHPKAGEIAPPAPPPPARIAELLAQLQGLPAAAEEEARTVEELRSQVRKLEGELRKGRKDTDSRQLDEVRSALSQARMERQQAEEKLAKVEGKLARAATITEDLGRLLRNGATPPAAAASAAATRPIAVSRTEPTPTPRAQSPAIVGQPSVEVSGPQQKVLDALATLLSFGEVRPDTTAVAMLAGYRPSTGHFNNIRGGLNSAGLIVAEAGTMTLTAEGQKLARPRQIRTLSELHSAWMEVLKGPQRRLLEVAIDRYPESMRTDELAAAAGYTPGTGHFNNLRGQLHTLGAITYPVAGMVRASDLLFPVGLS